MTSLSSIDDERYQDHILHGVSRTFALTIPQLPEALRRVMVMRIFYAVSQILLKMIMP